MLKLLSHIIVAAGLWFGTRALGVHWALACGAVVAGAFAVHFVWERVFFQPYAYLGTMPLASDDPLMAAARADARASFEKFRQLFPEHSRDTMVRFALRVKNGDVEYVWGDLLELTETTAKVYLRTPPVAEADLPNRTMDIKVEDIDDWQIEFTDGTLQGGFTNRALFRIFEREQGYMHPAFTEHMARFRDA